MELKTTFIEPDINGKPFCIGLVSKSSGQRYMAYMPNGDIQLYRIGRGKNGDWHYINPVIKPDWYMAARSAIEATVI